METAGYILIYLWGFAVIAGAVALAIYLIKGGRIF